MNTPTRFAGNVPPANLPRLADNISGEVDLSRPLNNRGHILPTCL
jgi:hypothetical protein